MNIINQKKKQYNYEINESKQTIVLQNLTSLFIYFYSTISKNFQESSLINFHNNLNELKINYEDFEIDNFMRKIGAVGVYDTLGNKISICNNGFLAIFHELFHMASSIYKKQHIYSGFRQFSIKENKSIGRGINEGYTQLLTERYFGNIKGVKKSYRLETNIASKIEQIIGKEKMENLYLSANLFGLVEELCEYDDLKNVVDFIEKVDFLNQNINNKNLSRIGHKETQQKLIQVNQFLLTSYMKNLKNQFDNNLLTQNEFNEKLETYVLSFPISIKCGNKIYQSLTKEVVNNILDNVFGNCVIYK